MDLIPIGQRIINAPNLAVFKEGMSELLTTLNIDYFSYYTKANDHILITNYPSEWVQEYLKLNYGELDPVVKERSLSYSPKTWDEYINYAALKDHEARFFEKASQYGINYGLAVKIKGSGYRSSVISLVVNKDKSLLMNDNSKCVIKMFASIINEKLLCFIANEKSKPILTARETEILHFASKGKTNWEISKILGISEDTIKVHIKNCITKLNAVSKTHAIVKAISTGNLNLQDVL